MAYRYRSRRSVKKLARRSRRNFIITLLVTGFLLYATVTWLLPGLINSIGFVKNIIKPAQNKITQTSDNLTLAPPVLNIPYEATNTAQIEIRGFGTPNSKVKLYLDDEFKQTADVSGDGGFTFENVNLSLGTNNIYGKTLDDQGKESLPSKSIRLQFDSENPPLNINEPEDGKVIQGGDKKVRVSGKTEPGAKVFVSGTQIIVDKDGNFGTDQPLNEGDNTLLIKTFDDASNTTEIQKRVTYHPQETQ